MARIVVENASLLDLERGEHRPGSHVVIEDDRIVAVGVGAAPAERAASAPGVAPGAQRPAAARRIDAGGRTLLPGLIDAHVHAVLTTMDLAALEKKPVTLVANEARLVLEGMLQRGFTSVRDAGGADWGLAQAVERGLIRGPRLFYAGRVLSQTGGHGDFSAREDPPRLCACSIRTSGFSHVADGVDAVRKAAREELRRGAHHVKIMASGGVASPSDPIWNLQYSEDEMRAIVGEARGWRTYAMAHAYTPEAIARAARAGVRSIEHGNLIDTDTARLLAECEAFLVPTLVTYFKIEELGRALGFPAVSQRKVKDVLEAGLASLEIARDAGVPMGFGTDLLGETHVHQNHEFAIRARVLTPLEILRSATLVNARLLGRVGELGVVAPGAFADLLLVDGDPLANVALLAEPEKSLALVMKGGVAALDRIG